MKCTVIFLHYRAGSTPIQHFLTTREKDGLTIPNLTPPKIVYKHPILGLITQTAQEQDTEHLLLSTHMGNWWGNTQEVPEPYDDRSPMKWHAEQIDYLERLCPDTDFRYITILRDGRNTVGSLFNLKGGIEERLRKDWGDDIYFKSLVLGWRNQARVALDNQSALGDRYRIFSFEDLMNTPIPTLGRMFGWMGYMPDWKQLSPRITSIKERKVGKKHTSFKDDATLHQRYLGWTDEQSEYFWKHCSKEMDELWYE